MRCTRSLPAIAVGMVIDGAALRRSRRSPRSGRPAPIADVLAFRAAPTAATGAWTQPNITLLTQRVRGHAAAAPARLTVCGDGHCGNVRRERDRRRARSRRSGRRRRPAAVAAFARGTVVCPGLAATPTPTAEYPGDVTSGTPVDAAARVRARLPLRRDARRPRRPRGRRDARFTHRRRGTRRRSRCRRHSSARRATRSTCVSSARVNPGRVLQLASPPLARAASASGARS